MFVDWHEERGVRWTSIAGVVAPLHYGDPDSEYAALTTDCGVIDHSFRGRLWFTDDDRLRFLHSMVTNEVNRLPAGRGNRTAFCNKKGRVLATARLYHLAGAVLVDVCAGQAPHLLAWVERHIVGDWVEVTDRSASWGCISLCGPGADQRLASVSIAAPAQIDRIEASQEVWVARLERHGLPCLDLFGPTGTLGPIWRELASTTRPVGLAALDIARVEAVEPRYGVDFNEENFTGELGLNGRYVSFTKGCFLGQETIARLHYRGNPNKFLVQLIIAGGAAPSVPTSLTVGAREVGRLTSAVVAPRRGDVIGLGLVKREWCATGTVLHLGDTTGTVVKSPYAPAQPGSD